MFFIGLQIIAFPCFQFGAKENISDVYDFVKRNNLNIGEIYEPIEVFKIILNFFKFLLMYI